MLRFNYSTRALFRPKNNKNYLRNYIIHKCADIDIFQNIKIMTEYTPLFLGFLLLFMPSIPLHWRMARGQTY